MVQYRRYVLLSRAFVCLLACPAVRLNKVQWTRPQVTPHVADTESSPGERCHRPSMQRVMHSVGRDMALSASPEGLRMNPKGRLLPGAEQWKTH